MSPLPQRRMTSVLYHDTLHHVRQLTLQQHAHHPRPLSGVDTAEVHAAWKGSGIEQDAVCAWCLESVDQCANRASQCITHSEPHIGRRIDSVGDVRGQRERVGTTAKELHRIVVGRTGRRQLVDRHTCRSSDRGNRQLTRTWERIPQVVVRCRHDGWEAPRGPRRNVHDPSMVQCVTRLHDRVDIPPRIARRIQTRIQQQSGSRLDLLNISSNSNARPCDLALCAGGVDDLDRARVTCAAAPSACIHCRTESSLRSS